MWTFRPGYLGVTIAVIALLGGVLLGSLLNVSSHDVATTKYDYVSDISGLFSVSEEPQYIDFNPASNYTGYTNRNADPSDPTGLVYEPAGQANNYRIPIRSSEEIAGPSGTINNSSSYPQADLGGKTAISTRLNSAEYEYSTPFTSYLSGFKVASVYDWATSVYGDLSQYITISVSVTIGAYTSPSTRAGFCAPISADLETTKTFDLNTVTGTTTYTLDAQNLTITGTVGGYTFTYSLYECYICYGDAVQVESYFDYTDRAWKYTSTNTTMSLSYTSRTVSVPIYDYLLPTAGVRSDTSTGTIWDNDTPTTQYDNRIIDILIGPNFDDGAFTWGHMGGAIWVAVYDLNDEMIGQFTLLHNWSGTGTSDYAFGGATGQGPANWPAYMLRLDRSGGGLDLDLYGVTSFVNYMDVQVSPISLFHVHTDTATDLDHLGMASVSSFPASWSVYRTNVFMDTYGAVLVDPSIDLADYWPDMDSYRYAFQSFALYGDSITLNGVTYPVTDQSITINDRTYKLDNFYLSFSEQGDASITFNNINKTVSLGATEDKTVSFGGYWGFSTGLYEGKTDVKKVYDWSIKLLGDNMNTIILIALALVAVLALACKWLGLALKMTDKVVLGGSALFLILLLVV